MIYNKTKEMKYNYPSEEQQVIVMWLCDFSKTQEIKKKNTL